MDYQEEIESLLAQAMARAEKALRASMAYNGQTYASLAPLLGITPASLSSQFSRRKFAAYQRVAIVYPPALAIAADLFLDVSRIYRRQHEVVVMEDLHRGEEIMRELRESMDRGKR